MLKKGVRDKNQTCSFKK